TALVNPPQAAILAVGAVYTRPVWDGGGVHPQRACELTLTADHRVLDGADAAAFLDTVTRALEDPGALVS
ncbi:MAG: 2-oxo acid dehydrogenase subunit E2, partial [Armatimonadetes bacterium]|nr:2-oxo acid dehydrogenase subunit E2 [Armatimonadota bacterium]